MFAGLFIIVVRAERELLTQELVARATHLHLDQLPVLSGVMAGRAEQYSWLQHPVHIPPIGHLRGVRHAVPFR